MATIRRNITRVADKKKKPPTNPIAGRKWCYNQYAMGKLDERGLELCLKRYAKKAKG